MNDCLQENLSLVTRRRYAMARQARLLRKKTFLNGLPGAVEKWASSTFSVE